MFRYDPSTDTWTMVASISLPRDGVGVCTLGDKLFAVGGYDGQNYSKEVECFDPVLNEWTKVCVCIWLPAVAISFINITFTLCTRTYLYVYFMHEYTCLCICVYR